jgi:hypothetical protein
MICLKLIFNILSQIRKAYFCHNLSRLVEKDTKSRLVPTLGKDFTKAMALIFKSL